MSIAVSSSASSSAVPAAEALHNPPAPPQTVAAFVCEDDVRQALRAGTRIVIGERTIVTPSARDLGDAHDVFVNMSAAASSWPK
jgi:hypothetical protein